jgi:ADP-heptose:LPS heptosyltransferase
LEVLVPAGFQTTVSPEGDTLIYPGGDRSAKPSGRMPKGFHFFDAIVRQDHFDPDHLNPDDNLQEFLPLTEAELQDLRRRLSAYCFDLAIDLRRHPETRHILQYTGARYLAGFDLDGLFPWLDIALEFEKDPIRIRKRTHVADELLDFANTISAACEPIASPITPPQMGALPLPASLTGSLFRRPVVCVHPAAGDLLKQWPAEYFAELIDLLVVRERVNVALVGAPADKDVGRAILSSLHHPEAVFDLIGELELEELPNLLMRCALFVGNDSGPKHLAAGLGVPTVAVHSGHVDVLEWGPLGSHAVAVRRDMECSPCYYSSPKQCPRNLACLTGLRAGQVYPVCKMLLIAGFGANLSARPAAPEAIGLELGNEPSRTSEPANSTDLGDGVATSGRKSAQRLDGPA